MTTSCPGVVELVRFGRRFWRGGDRQRDRRGRWAVIALFVVACTPGAVLPAAPAAAAAQTVLAAPAAPAAPEVVAAPEVAAAGTWVWPLTPRPVVVARFDPPDSPWGAGHRGVDLLGAERQTVRAAGAGVVSYAGLLAGRGVVAVTHGGLRTTYEPVAPSVAVGAAVRAGDPIGALTSSGSHCAPQACLHWGLLRGTRYLDPLTLVTAGPPRLLPLDEGSGGSFLLSPPSATPGPRATSARDGDGEGDGARRTGGASGAREPAPVGAAPSEASGPREDANPGANAGVGTSHGTTFLAAAGGVAVPAVGALAGALVAGLVIHRNTRARDTPPPTSPPGGPAPSGPPDRPGGTGLVRPGRAGVVELDSVRRRLRGAA